MIVHGTEAVFLGVTEREASGDKRGWTALDYVVVGEISSRRTFIDRSDEKLLADVRALASSEWGSTFSFDGEVDARGAVTFTAIYGGN